jgi:uncharacterized protein with FMN-binding domain
MVTHLKKIVLSLSIIVLFTLYALQNQPESADSSARNVSSTDPPPIPTAPARTTSSTTVKSASVTATATATATPPKTVRAATVQATAKSEPATATATATETATATATATTAASDGKYVDGTYTGDVADAHWGDLQVEVTIADGQISDVTFLDAPNHRSRSVSINNRADPILIREAIQAQDADVDLVTGATDTSEAFIESLASALKEAAA